MAKRIFFHLVIFFADLLVSVMLIDAYQLCIEVLGSDAVLLNVFEFNLSKQFVYEIVLKTFTCQFQYV